MKNVLSLKKKTFYMNLKSTACIIWTGFYVMIFFFCFSKSPSPWYIYFLYIFIFSIPTTINRMRNGGSITFDLFYFANNNWLIFLFSHFGTACYNFCFIILITHLSLINKILVLKKEMFFYFFFYCLLMALVCILWEIIRPHLKIFF